MEQGVRAIEADGLVWASRARRGQLRHQEITCVVEDDKVGVDFLEEHITALEDYVQSMDVASFNKL